MFSIWHTGKQNIPSWNIGRSEWKGETPSNMLRMQNMQHVVKSNFKGGANIAFFDLLGWEILYLAVQKVSRAKLEVKP